MTHATRRSVFSFGASLAISCTSLFLANSAVAQDNLFGGEPLTCELGPPLGQIVNWNFFPHTSSNFPTNKSGWQRTNAVMNFHKLCADTVIRCDVMVDERTTTSGRFSVGLFIDGEGRAEQSLAGVMPSPADGSYGVITFGFGYAIGPLSRGDHDFAIYASVSDGSTAIVTTTETGIQCYEVRLPRIVSH